VTAVKAQTTIRGKVIYRSAAGGFITQYSQTQYELRSALNVTWHKYSPSDSHELFEEEN
jgi:hypothetical protein